MFGVGAATILTLVVVPVLYYSWIGERSCESPGERSYLPVASIQESADAACDGSPNAEPLRVRPIL
ncbi:MAG: hypothetical protein NW701_06185 [Nitrospira sp.]